MKVDKKFDAVMLMREIRDKLSNKFSYMDFEEQKKFIREKLKTNKSLSSL
jgi:hypothetical protein